MNFKALKSIFGVGFVSFSMLLGVSISSALAMESLDDCPKNDDRSIVDQPGDFSDVDPIELEPDTDESNQNCPQDFIDAAMRGDLELVKRLLPDVDINCTNDMGYTALYFAAEAGHLPVVKFLLENDAIVDWSGFMGKTPLHAAAEGGHLDVVKWLVKNDADANHMADNGFIPIDVAWQMGKHDVVEFLKPYSGFSRWCTIM